MFLSCFTGAFDDAEVIHVEGDVDPIRDMEIIRDELRYVLNCSLDDSPHCEYSSQE